MALAPYTVTALAESDDQGTDGKNIIVGAVVSAAELVGGATATLYDNAAGSNPSTTKTTGSNGQVTFYIEEGQYVLTVNGVNSEISLLEADDAKVVLANANASGAGKSSLDTYTLNNEISGFAADTATGYVTVVRSPVRAGSISWNSNSSGTATIKVNHYDPTLGTEFYNVELWHTGNTTVDGSGFIKEASPIIKLFSDKIEKNNQVDNSVSLTINGVGDYTITGSEGFAQTGWYIENPKDANGNVKHFIEYTQDIDGTIHVKVYEPDYSLGYIKAGAPCNVVDGRWVDIRLHKTEE